MTFMYIDMLLRKRIQYLCIEYDVVRHVFDGRRLTYPIRPESKLGDILFKLRVV